MGENQQILDVLLYLFVFAFGACVGSFLNVCIYRPVNGLSIFTPKRSFCFSCKTQIPWYDNIPIFSYFILKGKCRNCGQDFSIRYALVEALTGFLFVVLLWKFGPGPELVVYALVTAGLIISTFVDFDHFIIPNFITFPGMILGLLWSVVVWFFFKESNFLVMNPLESLIGFLAGGGSLYLIGKIGTVIAKKEAMGFGDVKLLAMMGAFIGWKLIILTIVVSSFVGAIVGVAMIVTKKQEKYSYIPFGPYLALGSLISMIWGNSFIMWYIDNFLTRH